MDIVFVLVETETSANIGSTARALKTMGFHQLRLVKPKCDHMDGKAKALAHQSRELLEGAQLYDSLDLALEGVDLAIGCTARHRKRKRHYIDSKDLAKHIEERQDHLQKVAIVFGGETSGLNTEQIERCELLTTIALTTTKPSLNLSQAVMLYSYELSSFNDTTKVQTKDFRIDSEAPNPNSLKTLQKDLSYLIDRLDIPDPTRLKANITYTIARMGQDDLNLVHEIKKRIIDKLELTSDD